MEEFLRSILLYSTKAHQQREYIAGSGLYFVSSQHLFSCDRDYTIRIRYLRLRIKRALGLEKSYIEKRRALLLLYGQWESNS